MLRFFLLASLLVASTVVRATEPDNIYEIEKWQEAAVPPAESEVQRSVWCYAANRSNLEWQVFSERGKSFATSARKSSTKRPEGLGFFPKADNFLGGSAFASVDDGWLVGFNRGEFGAALYWFSKDGERHYKISNHQVVDFVSLPDGIYAIEGLAHMGISRGSVIQLARETASTHWAATTITKLPFAPYALSLRKDGTMLVTLSESIVSIGSDHKVRTLFSSTLWGHLYPHSSIISADDTKLYIGMRQFVGEFDLTSNQFRFLIPSETFLNKLPKDVEEQIRTHAGC